MRFKRCSTIFIRQTDEGLTVSNWQIHPYVGLGALRFGQRRVDVRKQLGDDYSTFQKAPGVDSETDSYDNLGLHLYYDENDCLEFIEAFSPCEVMYENVQLLRPDLKTVLTDLEDLRMTPRYDDQGYFFEDMGFALFASGDAVEGVSVYTKGYYDE